MKAGEKISSPALKTSTPIGRPAIIILLLILMVGIILRVLCFSGFYGSDDGVYAELAYLMANDRYDRNIYEADPVFPLRVGLLAPVILGFKLAGPDEKVMIAYPFLLSLLSIVIVFLAGKTFFNVRAGLISAAMLVILPIDIQMASRLLPDLPASFWGVLGILCLYLGSRRQDSRTKFLLGIFSGFCFGMSWLCKETVLYLFPFVGVYLFWIIKQHRKNINLLWGTGLSWGGIWIAESLIYYRLTQNFLFRLHDTARNFDIAKEWFFSEGSEFGWIEGGYGWALAKRILMVGPQKIFLNKSFGMVTGFAAIGCVYGLSKRSRAFGVIGIWFLSLAFMFNFTSTSFQFYRPLVLRDRYMYPLIFPALICVAAMFDLLVPKGKIIQWKNLLKLSFLILLILTFGILSINRINGMLMKNKGSPVEREVSHLLTPNDHVFTDRRTSWVLKFFWRYPPKTRAYVLINRKRLTLMHRYYGYEIPAFFEHAPKEWELRWQFCQAELYWNSGKNPQNPDMK